MKFEYQELKNRRTPYGINYTFDIFESYDLVEILNAIGSEGWEYVAEVRGNIIMKRVTKEGK